MLIQYTTVTQCLALMHWRCIVLLCQFHCVHESQAKHDLPQLHEDVLLWPGFFSSSSTAEEKYRGRLTRGTFSSIQDSEKAGSSSMTQ